MLVGHLDNVHIDFLQCNWLIGCLSYGTVVGLNLMKWRVNVLWSYYIHFVVFTFLIYFWMFKRTSSTLVYLYTGVLKSLLLGSSLFDTKDTHHSALSWHWCGECARIKLAYFDHLPPMLPPQQKVGCECLLDGCACQPIPRISCRTGPLQSDLCITLRIWSS